MMDVTKVDRSNPDLSTKEDATYPSTESRSPNCCWSEEGEATFDCIMAQLDAGISFSAEDLCSFEYSH